MLLAGQIGKPHGLSGEVYVVRISDDPSLFDTGARLFHADGRELTVASARPHRDRFLVRFDGFDDRDAAATLRGPLLIPEDERRALDEDEFWPEELEGCKVSDPDGRAFGTVSGVISNPGQDLLEVQTDAGVRFVPMVKEIVVSVDLEGRLVTVDPPGGLLD